MLEKVVQITVLLPFFVSVLNVEKVVNPVTLIFRLDCFSCYIFLCKLAEYVGDGVFGRNADPLYGFTR